MGVDDIRHRVITDIPHMLDDRRSSKHTILVPQQEFEERILFIGEGNFMTGSPDTVCSRI